MLSCNVAINHVLGRNTAVRKTFIQKGRKRIKTNDRHRVIDSKEVEGCPSDTEYISRLNISWGLFGDNSGCGRRRVNYENILILLCD